MLIKSIALTDFQGHEKLEIKFSPTITTIKGPTDRGKSSVLRALRWVCLNDLGGSDFIREGAASTSVLVRVEQGEHIWELERTKGGRVNTYLLDEEEFVAFGQTVPKDVADLLRVSDINFQAQHDGPFWFNESQVEVSRRLNAVVDLSIIDTCLSNIANMVRTASTRVDLCKEREKEAQNELDEIDMQRLRVSEWARLRIKVKRFEEVRTEAGELGCMIGLIVANNYDTLAEIAEDLSVIEDKARRVRIKKTWISDITEDIAALARFEAVTAPPDFSPVSNAYKRILLVLAQIKDLKSAVRLHEELEQEEHRATESWMKAEHNFHDQLKGENCPTCGTLIK